MTLPYTVNNLFQLVYHSTLKHKVLCATPLKLPIFKLKTKNKSKAYFYIFSLRMNKLIVIKIINLA